MSRGGLAALAVGAVLVAALTLFFVQSRVDLHLPRAVADAVQAFTRRESTLNRDLLLARYGHLGNMDPLVEHMRDLRASVEDMRDLTEGLDGALRDHARVALAEVSTLMARKDHHMERFKSSNAVLHASLAYFPTAVEDVLKELEAGRLPPAHRIAAERAVGDLNRAVTHLTVPGASGLGATSERAAGRLQAATAEGSAILRQAVADLTGHLGMIVAAKAALDDHLAAAMEVPAATPVQRLGALTAAALAEAAGRAGLFRSLLYGTAILLVLYGVAILTRLRSKAAALRRANVELRAEMQGRAAAEDRLEVTNKIFEHAVEGVVIADAAGVVQSVNPAFTAITGVEPGAAIGRSWVALTRHRRSSAAFLAIWRAARHAGQWQGEVWNTRPDGEDYAMMLTVTRIDSWSGAPRSYVAVFHDVTAAKANAEELHFRTYHDALTGLVNRAMVKNRLSMAIQLRRPDEHVALALLDLDNFRTINDGLGHAVGDALLKEVAQRLESVVDVETHTVGRLGGDEFALVLRGLRGMQEVVATLRDVFQQVARPLHLMGDDLYTSASVGVAVHPADGADAETLFKNADVALNRAKDAGRNTFEFYTRDMEEAVFRRLTMEANLRRGLKRDEFTLFYQPKICTRTGAVRGVEALVRWQPAGKPMVSPAEFIPVAEQTRLIVPLGRWILVEACRFAETRRRAGQVELTVAVNLSARQFRERTLIDDVGAALVASGLPPRNLELEITESMVMEDGEEAVATLRRLKAMGVGIAVDDFGTGYSSLSYLKRFPIDALKIDQSFVRDLTTDPDDRAIVAAVISLAGSLGLRVVAEGVETVDHLEHLRASGCEQAQGYLISRPLPAGEAATFLARHVRGWRCPAGPGDGRRSAAVSTSSPGEGYPALAE